MNSADHVRAILGDLKKRAIRIIGASIKKQSPVLIQYRDEAYQIQTIDCTNHQVV